MPGTKSKPYKNDWIQLKQEFFLSTFREAIPFLRSKGVNYVGTVEKHYKGWTDDKRVYREEIAKKAIYNPEVMEKQVQMTKMLVDAKELAIKSIVLKLSKENTTMDVQKLKLTLDLIKRELGEPLHIQQTNQVNSNDNSPELNEIRKMLGIINDSKKD
jgi:hypothetical protein